MKTAREHLDLLEDVLAESARQTDSLGATLRAVRRRHRRQNLAPFAGILLLAGLAWTWLDATRRSVSPGIVSLGTESPSMAVLNRPTEGIQRVNSVALDPAERVSTPTDLRASVTLRSESRGAVWASDDDLLLLAGGHGVGLLRSNGRAELLFARAY